MAVNAADALFAITRARKSKFMYQLAMSSTSIFVILSFSCPTSNFGNLFAEAQTSATSVQGEQDADQAIQTFYADGAIGSLVIDDANSTISEIVSNSSPLIHVLVGNWSMGVVNGEVNYLQVDFVMALEDGSQMQVYSIENLENIVIPPSSTAQNPGSTPDQNISSNNNNNNLVLSSANNYSLSLFGYVDVLTDDTVQWQNVPVSIDIFNGNTISILLYPADTDNRFNGQPIYGVVTEILNTNNEPIKPSIWAAAST